MNISISEDRGFFSSVPRIIRTGYQNLSATAKWIYVCLKDLCGENGTCYRTLRTLAQEIGVSHGVVSETIKILKEAGLITAEKKQRPGQTTKGMWHICIVNIWKLNGETHPTRKCSPPEQRAIGECSSHEHSIPEEKYTPKNVHSANKNVHNTNIPLLECSPHEQECSQNGTKEEEFKKDQLLISDEEEREEGPPTSSQATVSSFSHSSDNDSHFSQETTPADVAKGEVTNPPASVKGMSLSSVEGDDTLSLDTSPVPALGHVSSAQLSSLGHVHTDQTTTQHAPSDVASQCNTSPIVISSAITNSNVQETQDSSNVMLDGARLYEEKNQDDINRGGSMQDDAVSETPGNVADQQSCVTSVDEVKIVTQEMIMKWIAAFKDEHGQVLILPGKVLSRETALSKLLSLVHGPEDIAKLYKIKREWHPTGPVYIAHLANPHVTALFEQEKALESQNSAHYDDSKDSSYGMDKTTYINLIDENILVLYPELEQWICVDERSAPIYFFGIAKGENQWIDIACPNDWYNLDKEEIETALAWADYASVEAVAV